MSGRVAVYVDGFNLYHAIHNLNRPHLKWVDLWGVSQSLLRKDERLLKVLYFSAFATWMPDQYHRHRQYVAGLRSVGVTPHMARFKEKAARCRSCNATWTTHEEKETDVHVALSILEDALDDVFDRAVIISADSDYVPVVRKIRSRFPAKEMFLAIPPGRYAAARDMIAACSSCIEIKPNRLEKNLLPEVVLDSTGREIARRPKSYAKPNPI